MGIFRIDAHRNARKKLRSDRLMTQFFAKNCEKVANGGLLRQFERSEAENIFHNAEGE
jgi:hypothetical protein